MKTKLIRLFLSIAMFCVLAPMAYAQGTSAFTYQGQLRDGSTNANGAYSLTFKLFNASGGGSQIGSTLVAPSQSIVNGLFSVNLDFGGAAFDGNARWLEITVGTDVLAPRVAVLPAPYSLFAAVAGTVTNRAIMNAQLALNAVATANIQNNAITTALIADGAVTNGKLTADAVNAPNIASGQVVKSLNGLTDAVTLSKGANVNLFSSGNNIQISAAVPNFQVFEANGTFIVPTNVTRIMVEVWGGGGGGGGNGTSNSGAAGGRGGGGGGGGYGKDVISVTPGNSMTVTVGLGGTAGGSGGTSSLGSVSATGGAAGQNGGNAYSVTVGAITTYYPGSPGNGGDPGSSTASIRIAGVQGGGGAATSGAGYNSAVAGGGNGQGGAGANGGAGGAAGGGFPGAFMRGQSPGGGGSSDSSLGAEGRVIVWY